MKLKAVQFTPEGRLIILDQTQLPGRVEYVELTGKQELIEAITGLRLRGAPAIGIAAAYGLAALARLTPAPSYQRLVSDLLLDSADIKAARPTAVNLAWALERMESILRDDSITDRETLLAALESEARAIDAEDAALSRDIASHGLPLIREGCGVLTHCNAGSLATSELGTALAPLYLAHELGMRFTVYCDETRPLLQGARLTALELSLANIDTVLICDNMAASLMAGGRIDLVIVGADRIAANGDVANKIGTLSVAVNARHFGIPFYVAAPSSSVDPATLSGADIVVEQRPGSEITHLWYERPQAPEGIKTLNPAFDITPAALISGIIDEHGIHRPPYDFSAYHKSPPAAHSITAAETEANASPPPSRKKAGGRMSKFTRTFRLALAAFMIMAALIIGLSLRQPEQPPPDALAAIAPPPAAEPVAEPQPPEETAPPESGAALDPDRPFLALTFDDGPNPAVTPQLVEGLNERGVRATFFVLGEQAARYPETVALTAAGGHQIASHGWDHQHRLPELSDEQLQQELDDTSAVIEEIVGYPAAYMRPPYGAIDLKTAAKIDVPLMLWNIDPQDWASRDAEAVADHIVENAFSGGVVILHDQYQTTAEGALQAIDILQPQGWQFVTLDEYYLLSDLQPSPGVTYRGRLLADLK